MMTRESGLRYMGDFPLDQSQFLDRVKELEELANTQASRIRDCEKILSEREDQISVLRVEVNALGNAKESLEAEFSRYSERQIIQSNDHVEASLRYELNALRAELDSINAEFDREMYERGLQVESEKFELTNQIEYLNGQVQELRNLMDGLVEEKKLVEEERDWVQREYERSREKYVKLEEMLMTERMNRNAISESATVSNTEPTVDPKRLTELEEQLQNATSEIEQFKNAVVDHTRIIGEQETMLDQLRSQNASLQQSSSDKDTELTSLRSELQHIKLGYEDIHKRYSALQNEHLRIGKQLEQVRSTHMYERSVFQEEILSLRAALNHQRPDEIAALKKENLSLKEESTRLRLTLREAEEALTRRETFGGPWEHLSDDELDLEGQRVIFVIVWNGEQRIERTCSNVARRADFYSYRAGQLYLRRKTLRYMIVLYLSFIHLALLLLVFR